jgi:putative chitinase
MIPITFCAAHGVDTPLRQAHFMAQCDHESQGFTRTEENLNYSSARLLQIFPTHFNSKEAQAYAHQPEEIANRVYANRMGNGDEKSGDGWEFRGRGYLQLTGRETYERLGYGTNPHWVSTPDGALTSACRFWNSRGLSQLADHGTDIAVVRLITHSINGGGTGLPERYALFKKYAAELGVKV